MIFKTEFRIKSVSHQKSKKNNSLIFVPCIIRRSRNNQRYALICNNSFILYTDSYMFRQ
jgi:hypothetical protein